MSSLRKIQLLAIGVIVNCAMALAILASQDAHAAPCGYRYECSLANCNNPFWAQSACSANLPQPCAYTIPLACFNAGTTACPYMVLCEDHQ